MFKCCILFTFLVVFKSLSGQSLDTIKKLLLEQKIIEAKTEVENFLSIPENDNNAYAWYFKGFIYNLISKDSSIELPMINPKAIAFNAFTKCLTLKPQHKWLANDNYEPIFDIYNSFFENGKKEFVNKNYETALDHFLNAEKVEQFLYNNKIKYKGFSFTALDTSLLFNIATTALKANKEKEGIFYFVRIAESRINDPIYLPIYHALVNYFISTNDEIGFRKYLQLGRKLFPYDNYWVQAETDMVKSGHLNEALIKSYLDKIKADPNNLITKYSFCTDLIRILYDGEEKPKKFNEWRLTLENQIAQYLSLQKTGVKAEYLFATYYYKDAIAKNFQLRTEDQNAQKNVQFTKALPYARIVFEEYEKNSKLNRYELEAYKSIAKIIIEMYEHLGNKEAVNTFTEKLKNIALLLPVYIPPKKSLKL